MTDICDRAAEREETFRDDALAARKRCTAAARRPVECTARHCRVCDEAIPEARRRAIPGAETCVDCQEMLERGLLA